VPPVSNAELLEEYRLNVDLWKHDDTLRQSHNQTFLGVTSALLVAAGLVIAASNKLAVQGASAVAAALFGIAVACVWRRAQVRHNAYIRFHREMLITLEESLNFCTFTYQSAAFQRPWGQTTLEPGGKVFELKAAEQKSGSDAEARLPNLVLALWCAALIAGLVAIVEAW
jgi:hypothetical protein